MVIIMIVMSMMLTCSTRPVGPSSHPATAIPPLLYSSVSGGTMIRIMIRMIMIMIRIIIRIMIMIMIMIMIRMIRMFVTMMIMIAQLHVWRYNQGYDEMVVVTIIVLIIVSVSETHSFQESQRPFFDCMLGCILIVAAVFQTRFCTTSPCLKI